MWGGAVFPAVMWRSHSALVPDHSGLVIFVVVAISVNNAFKRNAWTPAPISRSLTQGSRG